MGGQANRLTNWNLLFSSPREPLGGEGRTDLCGTPHCIFRQTTALECFSLNSASWCTCIVGILFAFNIACCLCLLMTWITVKVED